jgi:hypothetical protein
MYIGIWEIIWEINELGSLKIFYVLGGDIIPSCPHPKVTSKQGLTKRAFLEF